jgi:hypothetical protein
LLRGPDIDIALMGGEIDARAGTGETIIRRTPEWLEKGLVDIHAGIEIPKGQRHPRFAHLPELESFAGSAREKRLLEMFRAFRLSGQSFFFPRKRRQNLCKFCAKPCERHSPILNFLRSLQSSQVTIRHLSCRKLSRKRSKKCRVTPMSLSCSTSWLAPNLYCRVSTDLCLGSEPM